MKAFLYARVSSKEQAEGYSILAQLDLLREYAFSKGFLIEEEFIESESAKAAGRAEFNKLVEKMKNGPIKILLAEKTDRLYRNFPDFVKLDFEQLDLEIHLVKENEILNRNSRSHQKLTHGLKVLLAKNYCDNLSEETKKGMYKKLEEGGYPFQAPIGFKNDLLTKTVVVDTVNADWVKRAFSLFKTGQYSLSALNAKLYDEGFRAARSKKKPNKESMKRILSNPFYFGEACVKGKFYKLNHEPLITKEVYEEVQILLKKRNKPKYLGKNLPFAGLMVCGHCGRSITGEEKRKSNGKTYVYYHCTGTKLQCSNVVYLEQRAILSVLDAGIKQISIPEEVAQLAKSKILEGHQDEVKASTEFIRSLKTEYIEIEKLINAAYEEKLMGKIAEAFWDSMYQKWEQRKADIKKAISFQESRHDQFVKVGLETLELAKNVYSLYERQEIQEKKKLINLVLSNCKIVNGSVEFNYRKPFDLFVKYNDLKEWGG